MPSSTDYGDLVQGKLAARLASGVTSGATVTVQTVNDSPITWPTGAHRLKLFRKTRSGIEVETIGVASASQSGSTVTLGTLTRQLSLTSGTSFSSGGDGRTFPANTDVFLTWDVFDAELTPKLDIANTFTGSGAIRSSSTTTSVIRSTNVTTAQRLAMSPANGDEVYDTDIGTKYDYIGGAWVQRAADTTANGSTTVAGRYEEATVAEQGSATATGATGARLVPAVANFVKTGAGSGDENKLNVLNSAGVHDVSVGGTGVRNPTSGSVYVGAGSSPMTAVAPSTSGNVLKSNGSTWVSGTVPSTSTVVYLSGASSTTQTNPTSTTAFDTHTYTIPANDLTATTGYEFEFAFSGTVAAGAIELGVMLGSTAFSNVNIQANAGTYHITGFIVGTAAAGASVNVRSALSGGCGSVSAGDTTGEYVQAAVATNGTLVLAPSAKFSSSNGGNNVTCTMGKIKKVSTTAF